MKRIHGRQTRPERFVSSFHILSTLTQDHKRKQQVKYLGGGVGVNRNGRLGRGYKSWRASKPVTWSGVLPRGRHLHIACRSAFCNRAVAWSGPTVNNVLGKLAALPAITRRLAPTTLASQVEKNDFSQLAGYNGKLGRLSPEITD